MFKKNNKPKKPDSLEEKVDNLWDMVHNHLWSKMTYLDWKVTFLTVLVAAHTDISAYLEEFGFS